MSSEERRGHKRKRVHFGAQAVTKTEKLNGVVRNYSEAGACIEFAAAQAPHGEIDVAVPRENRACKAKVIWTQHNKAGVAFQADAPSLAPILDTSIEEKLRKTERKVRVLRHRVRQLTGEG